MVGAQILFEIFSLIVLGSASNRANEGWPTRAWTMECPDAAHIFSSIAVGMRLTAHPRTDRTCGIPAYGSHLGCLTASVRRPRVQDAGWGRKSFASRLIRSHVVRSFWLRRRSARARVHDVGAERLQRPVVGGYRMIGEEPVTTCRNTSLLGMVGAGALAAVP